MNEDNGIAYAIFTVLITIACLLVWGLINFNQVEKLIEKQYQYDVDMQMCIQEANKHFTTCHIEMETDGSINWYYDANERSE